MLTRLRHRTVTGRYHQNGSVHLGRACNHILDIVSVPGAVNVRIVTLLRLILHMSRIYRNTPLFLLRRIVYVFKSLDVALAGFVCQPHRDCRRQCRLAVVNMTDSSDIDVWFCPFKYSLSHLTINLQYTGLIF
ncbi:hypothetical protein ES703_102206 [subsurface metagenome]